MLLAARAAGHQSDHELRVGVDTRRSHTALVDGTVVLGVEALVVVHVPGYKAMECEKRTGRTQPANAVPHPQK